MRTPANDNNINHKNLRAEDLILMIKSMNQVQYLTSKFLADMCDYLDELAKTPGIHPSIKDASLNSALQARDVYNLWEKSQKVIN